MAPAHCGGTPELLSIPESLPRLRSDRASSRPSLLQALAAVPGPSSLLDSGIINMKRRQEASYLTTWKLVSGNINRECTNLSLTHLLHTHNQPKFSNLPWVGSALAHAQEGLGGPCFPPPIPAKRFGLRPEMSQEIQH